MFLLLKVLCVLERLEVWLLVYNTADMHKVIIIGHQKYFMTQTI